MSEPRGGGPRDRPVRVGVVGLGFGAAVHVPALQSLKNVTIVGIAGHDPAKAAATAERLGLPAGVGGIDALLSLQPEVLTVAVPPTELESAVLKAFDAGCAVLCEKPLGNDLGAASRLTEAVGCRLAGVDFQFAELPVFRRLKNAIETETGGVRHATITWLVESYAQRQGVWSWKTDAARGGGALNLLGSHLLYLVEWLFGPIVALSAAMTVTAPPRRAPADAQPAEDLVHLQLFHESGSITSAVVGNANPGLSTHSWHIVGETGSLRLENRTSDYMKGFSLIGFDQLSNLSLVDPEESGDGRLGPFRSLAMRFLDTFQSGGRLFRPSFTDGLRVQMLMQRVIASARTRSEVEVLRY